MSRLAFVLIALLLPACATVQGPPPLTDVQIIELAKSGATAPQIIEELKRTNTVLMLQGSDFARLAQAGVPKEVLDYLHQQMIAEIRWRERAVWGPYGPYGPGFGVGFGWGSGFPSGSSSTGAGCSGSGPSSLASSASSPRSSRASPSSAGATATRGRAVYSCTSRSSTSPSASTAYPGDSASST